MRLESIVALAERGDIHDYVMSLWSDGPIRRSEATARRTWKLAQEPGALGEGKPRRAVFARPRTRRAPSSAGRASTADREEPHTRVAPADLHLPPSEAPAVMKAPCGGSWS